MWIDRRRADPTWTVPPCWRTSTSRKANGEPAIEPEMAM